LILFIKRAVFNLDPIDICGKNSELVLRSRVKGFEKRQLDELLYKDRILLDYFDKNLSIILTIILTTDWVYFGRYRQSYQNNTKSFHEINAVCDEIKKIILKRGVISSADINFGDTVDWYWNKTRLSRAALECMYYRGDLVICHKKGTIKYYDLSQNHIDAELLGAPEPYPDELDYLKWRLLRRIGAVGLLWNRPSDAWLNIWELKSDRRKQVFSQLLLEEKIIEAMVEGIDQKLYCLSSDMSLLEEAQNEPKQKARCEIIAPLDNMQRAGWIDVFYIVGSREHVKGSFCTIGRREHIHP